MTPFDAPVLKGKLIRRYKRFFVDVRLADGTEIVAHNPNTGSMMGLLDEGNPVLVTHNPSPKRKLGYTLQAIGDDNGGWVGVNTQLPNRVVQNAIESGDITELSGYGSLRREVKYGREGRSRIDIHLSNHPQSKDAFVEVKNVTLKENGGAQFPDAVTTRGQKHLEELMDIRHQGNRAVMFYVVARVDCDDFSPARQVDPEYAILFEKAREAGIEMYARRAIVNEFGWELGVSLKIV